MKALHRAILVGVVLALAVADAGADAIVRTQAMLASTVAEVFIEHDRIRVELEIGLADLQAFPSLLPDEIYERLGSEPRPFGERIPEFFERDLVIVADDGKPFISASSCLLQS